MRKPTLWNLVLAGVLAGTGLAAGRSGAVAADDVFRWVDDKGVVHFSDKPPAPDAKPVQLPQLQTFKSGTPPPLPPSTSTGAAPVAAAGSEVSIVAPAQEETIRDAEGHVSVSVNAQLPPGCGLVYYLDGAAQNAAATPSTAFLLNGVERGEHQIAVAMVAVDGHELARSGSVTIFMKPPDVGMSAKKAH
jgi:hypothetical protein